MNTIRHDSAPSLTGCTKNISDFSAAQTSIFKSLRGRTPAYLSSTARFMSTWSSLCESLMRSASQNLQRLLHKMEPSKLPQRGFLSVYSQQTALGIFHQAIFMLIICCADIPLTQCLRPFAKTSAAPGVTAANGTTFKKIFILGDSYVDNGNRNPNDNTKTAVGPINQPWKVPYGQSHPEGPSGRFSDGKVLSDYFAGYMDLNPRPYNVYQDRPATRTEDGINFAVGGAGVFNNLEIPKTSVQIAQLQAMLTAGVYSPVVYNDSLILFTISGNDYYAFLRNSPTIALPGIGTFIVSVVHQIVRDLKSLYDLGFRYFAVPYLPPVGCIPAVTRFTEHISCIEIINAISTTHNNLLHSLLSNASTLPEANVILLNTELAFTAVFNDPFQTEFPAPLKPCCCGIGLFDMCGDQDKAGKPLYTVCNANSTASFFFWDQAHPTEAGWAFVFQLFLQDDSFLYTNGKNLTEFLHR